MKVFPLTVSNSKKAPVCLTEFQLLASKDRFGHHQLCETPETAALILVLDFHLLLDDALMRHFYAHPTVRKFSTKVFAYDRRPNPWPTCCGLFVSPEKRFFDPKFQIAAVYPDLPNRIIENWVEKGASQPEPQFLATFTGAKSHPLRRAILEIENSRFFLQNRVVPPPAEQAKRTEVEREAAKTELHQRYIDEILDAKFVLCPRGRATSSFRLYETLALGRVPVILADDWVAPAGPDWNACAVRVGESEVARLPQILAAREPQWPEMSAASRAAWAEFFAPEVRFHRAIEGCAALLERGVSGPRPVSLFNRAFQLNLVRTARRRAIESLRHSRLNQIRKLS